MKKTSFLRTLLILLCCVSGSGHCLRAKAAEASEIPNYQLGRGYHIDQLGLIIGGYLNISFDRFENHNSQLTLDDASLFLSWKIKPWLRLFTELEFEDSVLINRDGIHSSQATFSIERLYLDVLISEQSTLRLGKFLTPVGYWNETHAAPLVWTTSRPLVTDRPFPKHSSGAMLHGTLTIASKDVDYAVFADDSSDLDPKKTEIYFNNAFGGRLRLSLSDFSTIGISYVNFRSNEQANNPSYNLLALDFEFKRHYFEITSEFTYRFSESSIEQKGLYLQGVMPLGKNFYAVGRCEYFDDGQINPNIHLGIAGLAYRPIPSLVFKAEYRIGRHNSAIAASGFLSSIAILF
jgi:hypothetical protein